MNRNSKTRPWILKLGLCLFFFSCVLVIYSKLSKFSMYIATRAAAVGTIAFVIFVIILIIESIKDSKKAAVPNDDRTRKPSPGTRKGGVDVSVNKKMNLTPEEAAKIKKAGQDLLSGRMDANHIRNAEVRKAAVGAYTHAEKIIKTLKEQPDEIRKCHQFLNYYLPTLGVILSKYRTVEESGIDVESTTEKVLPYLSDITKAMEEQYNSLFAREVLDLTVEMEAMQLAFERDGLISNAEIPKDTEKPDVDLKL